jgi:hypothetical protein
MPSAHETFGVLDMALHVIPNRAIAASLSVRVGSTRLSLGICLLRVPGLLELINTGDHLWRVEP